MKTENLTIYSNLRAWRIEKGLIDNNWETFANITGKRTRTMFWYGVILGAVWTLIFIYLIIPFLEGLLNE